MGLFSKQAEQSAAFVPPEPAPITSVDSSALPLGKHGQAPDPRLPGLAGFVGVGLRKNAMPEMRFNFVRPDQQQQRR